MTLNATVDYDGTHSAIEKENDSLRRRALQADIYENALKEIGARFSGEHSEVANTALCIAENLLEGVDD